MEGRVLPAGAAERKASLDLPGGPEAEREFTEAPLHHALTVAHGLH
jgi:hypothetical protein